MEAFIKDKNGVETKLSVLLGWDFIHSTEACDSFEIKVLFSPELLETLSSACEIACTHEGKTVFVGVVDEYTLRADSGGATAQLSGRGYGARLLDNEAEAAEYWGAKSALILERHVYPYGIKNVRTSEMQTTGRFVVSSGDSQWHVLREFCYFAGGITPRFDRFGTLLLNGERGSSIVLDNAPISSQIWQDRRYGQFSHVLVKNRAAWTSTTAENAEFIARGGLCRRVVNVPRYTGYDAMRHTGEYQIAQSKKDSRSCKITIPRLFAAFAGDTLELKNSPLGIKGSFYVTESRCIADGESSETILTLRED